MQALSVAPPEFADPPQLANSEPLAPAPRSPSGGKAVFDGIIGGNLFETQRGYIEIADEGGDAVSEEPLPPPTNVILTGVFFQPGGRPMVIMTDTSAGDKQLTLGLGRTDTASQIQHIGADVLGESTMVAFLPLGDVADYLLIVAHVTHRSTAEIRVDDIDSLVLTAIGFVAKILQKKSTVSST